MRGVCNGGKKMVSHLEVARAWARGDKLKGSRMFTDGNTVWSYGTHFPIATKLDNGQVLFNDDQCSSSTSGHQSYVKRVIDGYDVIECDTDEILRAVRNPKGPIMITKLVKHESFEGILNNLRDYLKEKGMERFPKKRVQTAIENAINKHIQTIKVKEYDMIIKQIFNEFFQKYQHTAIINGKVFKEELTRNSNIDEFKHACIDELERMVAEKV